jgi:hypothetical protein
MRGGLFWRAATVQALLVGVLFAVLVLTLPRDFFADYGLIVGPLAWVGCALATGRILKLSLALTAGAAAISGAAAALVGQALEHIVSLPVAIGVFAACCAAYESNYGAPRSIDERV